MEKERQKECIKKETRQDRKDTIPLRKQDKGAEGRQGRRMMWWE